MTELRSIGQAVSQLTGMRLRLAHALLRRIQIKDLLALKAKNHFLQEETAHYFKQLAAEAAKTADVPDAALQLDIFLSLAKSLKMPVIRLNDAEKTTAYSSALLEQWFAKKEKADKEFKECFGESLIKDKLEFLLHYESVQLLNRFVKNEKVDAAKKPLQEQMYVYWSRMPEYQKVQIFEHRKARRDMAFTELIEQIGTGPLLFEMGSRAGFGMYRDIFASIHEEIPPQMPTYMWIFHPDGITAADAAIKSWRFGSWSLPFVLLLAYLPPEQDMQEKADITVLSSEWQNRELKYRLLLRQINELKRNQQKEEERLQSLRLHFDRAQHAEEQANGEYRNLRERLIVRLQTDSSRPFLGDLSVAQTRLREKQDRLQSKLDFGKSEKSVLKTASSWFIHPYLKAEKNALEKKHQALFEQMADEIVNKYPYYDAELIEEIKQADASAKKWSQEKKQLKQQVEKVSQSLADMKNKELTMREKAAEAVVQTPGLKQIGVEDQLADHPLA